MNPFILLFHNFHASCLPAILRSMTSLMFQVDRFHQCKRLSKNKGVRDMSTSVGGMSMGLCPKEYVIGVCHREYVQGVEERQSSLFLTEALGRFEMWSKWFKSKEIWFYALIRVRRFPGFWFQCVVLLSSSNKIPKGALLSFRPWTSSPQLWL